MYEPRSQAPSPMRDSLWRLPSNTAPDSVTILGSLPS